MKTFNLNSDEWDGTRDREGWHGKGALVGQPSPERSPERAVSWALVATVTCGRVEGRLVPLYAMDSRSES
jgi:hypothetical protein